MSKKIQKFLYAGFLLIFSLFALGACDFTNGGTIVPPDPEFTLTVLSDNTEYGTAAGGGDFKAGSPVTVTASAARLCGFTGWYDGENLVSSQSSYSFSMPNKNLTLTAKFILKWTYSEPVVFLNAMYDSNDIDTMLPEISSGHTTIYGFRLKKETPDLNVEHRLDGGEYSYAADEAFYSAGGRHDFKVHTHDGLIKEYCIYVSGHTSIVGTNTALSASYVYFGTTMFGSNSVISPQSHRVYSEESDIPVYVAGETEWHVNAVDEFISPVSGFIKNIDTETVVNVPATKEEKSGTLTEAGLYTAEFCSSSAYWGDDFTGSAYTFKFSFRLIPKSEVPGPVINKANLEKLSLWQFHDRENPFRFMSVADYESHSVQLMHEETEKTYDANYGGDVIAILERDNAPSGWYTIIEKTVFGDECRYRTLYIKAGDNLSELNVTINTNNNGTTNVLERGLNKEWNRTRFTFVSSFTINSAENIYDPLSYIKVTATTINNSTEVISTLYYWLDEIDNLTFDLYANYEINVYISTHPEWITTFYFDAFMGNPASTLENRALPERETPPSTGFANSVYEAILSEKQSFSNNQNKEFLETGSVIARIKTAA